MRRTLAILSLSLGCAKAPQPATAAPPTESGAPGAGSVDDGAEAQPDLGLAWHTLQVGTTKVQYATLGTPREGGPVLLALPPGPQTREMVVAGLEPWADALVADGWFVLSPVSPNGTFFAESAAVLPGFLDAAAQTHALPSEGLYLFGMSNGGLSAFSLAIAQPQRFAALVTMPGRPTDADMDKLGVLSAVPVTMVVGAKDDAFWIDGAQAAKDALEAAGGTVTLVVLPEAGHGAHLDYDWPALRALLGA